MPETMVRSKIDSAVKAKAQNLLQDQGLSISEAIRLFINQVVVEKGLPFKVELSKGDPEEHDRWFRKQVKTAIKEASNPNTVFIPHAQVRDRWSAKRVELSKRTLQKRNQV